MIEERRKIKKVILYSIMMTFLSMVAVSIAGILYTGHVARENNQQWCRVLGAIDDAYKDANVTSPAGQRIAGEFHNLKISFEC